MSIEQKIREILSESSQDLSEDDSFVPEETDSEDYEDAEQLNEWEWDPANIAGTAALAVGGYHLGKAALTGAANVYQDAKSAWRSQKAEVKYKKAMEARKAAREAEKQAKADRKANREQLNQGYEYEDNDTTLSDYVDALTNGEELTEEFKEKAATIFEAAVVDRVKSELQELQEAYEEHIEEELTSITEGLIEKVDGYLDYVVEQWMEQNEIALERGMKSEILENFVSGLKNLFEENYIELPEEKFDVLGSMEEKVDKLTDNLNEMMEKNIQMKKEVAAYQLAQALSETAEGLVATDKERFLSLVEELEFEDVDSFSRKAQIIRENYFTNKAPARQSGLGSIVTDTPVQNLNEEATYVAPQMRAYTSFLNNNK